MCVCVHKCLLECAGLEDLTRSFFGQSQEDCGCKGGNSFSVVPDDSWVIFGMMLGNR